MSEAPAGPRPRPPPEYRRHHHACVRDSAGPPERDFPALERYAFCLCLHVRPTTIFIAAFKLISALLFIGSLLNPELSFEHQASSMPNYDGREAFGRSAVIAVGLLTRSIVAGAAGLATYAVISAKATLLMPLYSVLLVDFFFALPSFYARDVDTVLGSDGMLGLQHGGAGQPIRSEIFISTLVMVAKIYCLCVIWKCYRYLRLIQLVNAMMGHQEAIGRQVRGRQSAGLAADAANQTRHDAARGYGAPPPPYESLADSAKAPPNYEEAVKPAPAVYTIEIDPDRARAPT